MNVDVCKHGRNCRRCCWEWQGKRSKGYGYLCYRSSTYVASRLALVVHHHAQTLRLRGVVCCHRCNNPPCCNPHHLFWATSRENVLDAREQGLVRFYRHRPRRSMAELRERAPMRPFRPIKPKPDYCCGFCRLSDDIERR